MDTILYRLELANKIENGHNVGNKYLVAKVINGCRANTVGEFDDRGEAERYRDALLARGRPINYVEGYRDACQQIMNAYNRGDGIKYCERMLRESNDELKKLKEAANVARPHQARR